MASRGRLSPEHGRCEGKSVPRFRELSGTTRVAFDDPALLGTIGDVCAAHGLQQGELDDRDRFPERRDIQGQLVNVRFATILFRMGDLLDMSQDRACPLLLNAACPLPPDSLAHWTQYQRIVHNHSTGPRRSNGGM